MYASNKIRGNKNSVSVDQITAKEYQPTAATFKHFTVSKNMQQQRRLDDEPIVKSIKAANPASSSKSIEQPTIKTTKQPNQLEKQTSGDNLIHDLCQVLRNGPSGISLGYLIDRSQKHVELFSAAQSKRIMDSGVGITLDQVLEGQVIKPY